MPEQRLYALSKSKNWIKKNRHAKNPIVRFVVENLYACAYARDATKRILVDKQYRAIWRTKLLHPSKVHQTTPATAANRFPTIFRACKDYFGTKEDIKILSFGCSTGEEVLTLRQYFPNATIVGAEINKYSLKICRSRQWDENIIFIDSVNAEIHKHGPYDAVFCMAVFQRTPQLVVDKNITNLSRVYPFKRFDRQICELDRCIKPGGLFVVHFSQYDFNDTKIAASYSVYGDYNQSSYGSSVFDKDSKIVLEPQKRHSIFIKSQPLGE